MSYRTPREIDEAKRALGFAEANIGRNKLDGPGYLLKALKDVVDLAAKNDRRLHELEEQFKESGGAA